MAALMLNAGSDMVTARLIRSAKALKLSAQVPPETGRKLVDLASAVRLFMECRENAAALAVLAEITVAVTSDEPEMKPAAEVMARAVEACRRHLDFEARTDRTSTGSAA
jgi:hypothetical protein